MLNACKIFLIPTFFIIASASDADPATDLQQAISSFDAGNYPASIAAYEKLLQTGSANGHLYYNLANAFYKQGDKGSAMASLLAAHSFLPRDPDVRANLAFLQKNLNDKLDFQLQRPDWQTVFFWIDDLNLKEQLYLGAGIFFLSGLLLFLSLVSRLNLSWLRFVAGFTCFVALIFFGGAYVRYATHASWGAVVSEVAKVRSGPSSTNGVLFELRTGAPVAIKEEVNGWYQIELSDRKKGWIEKSEARVFAEQAI